VPLTHRARWSASSPPLHRTRPRRKPPSRAHILRVVERPVPRTLSKAAHARHRPPCCPCSFSTLTRSRAQGEPQQSSAGAATVEKPSPPPRLRDSVTVGHLRVVRKLSMSSIH
jgi:hypothetical protein